jgi:CRISPR/Cas system-associated exonuclease Cas4 (RecB family)
MTIFAQHLRPTVTVWKHDRSKTVGASEIGACARQTWMVKNGVAEEGERNWGFGERGHVIEDWAFRTWRHNGIKFRNRQYTIENGHLSATLDGVRMPRCADTKSFDPRKNEIVEPKHVWQVQVQIGLWNDKFKAKLKEGVLVYINASDFQDRRELVVQPDTTAYAAAHERAKYIMTTKEPPPREGHMAGGKECRMCLFQTACLGKPIEDRGKLSETDTAAVAAARLAIQQCETAAADAEGRIRHFKEQIREILRAADVRRAPELARISRSQRTSLDQAAMERDGIDLTPYRKLGRETEQVTVE